tara:strand:- start:4 stop:417 length:414 start_codon:yes stop_codon:yes gene_type:complete
MGLVKGRTTKMFEIPFMCIALAVYYEARGESPEGQRQVVHVIENRVNHSAWPDDACAVVKQKGAFSFYWDGKDENPKDARAWAKAQLSVREAWENPWENAGATHYHADYVSPPWSRSNNMTRLGKIGTHIFYSEDRR